MVPLDLTFVNGSGERKLHFEMVNHPKLTPLLVALTTFNGHQPEPALWGRNDTAPDGRNSAEGACAGADREYDCAERHADAGQLCRSRS